MTDLQRTTRVIPAYDCIRIKPCVHGSEACTAATPDNPGRSHGVHNAELHMRVAGPRAEVTLAMGTGWDLPSVPSYIRSRARQRFPWGKYVEFHTDSPQFEGHEPSDRAKVDPGEVCVDWSACYFNAGYGIADEPAALLVEKGSDAVWAWLEAEYDRIVCQMLDVQ